MGQTLERSNRSLPHCQGEIRFSHENGALVAQRSKEYSTKVVHGYVGPALQNREVWIYGVLRYIFRAYVRGSPDFMLYENDACRKT